jgi:hypothetical protein
MRLTTTRAALFIGVSTQSARCGSFRRMPPILREDHVRLFAERAIHDLSSEFRLLETPLSSGHPNDRTSITSRSTSPTSH